MVQYRVRFDFTLTGAGILAGCGADRRRVSLG
jgi:hypothetical protein